MPDIRTRVRLRDFCLPCAAVAALGLAACRLYGLIAPLHSPEGRCRATNETIAGASCKKGTRDNDAGWLATLPDVEMLGFDDVYRTCDITWFTGSNDSCTAFLRGQLADPHCNLSASAEKAECQVCWYEPWRRDESTLAGLLFGRDKSEGCDITGDDGDSWSASFLYLLVAAALLAYLVAFCCRCSRDPEQEPLVRDSESDRVVEDAGDADVGSFYNAGTPHGRHCSICMVNVLCVILEPCMHLATCADCSKSVRHCPICRQPISRRLQIQVRDFVASSPGGSDCPGRQLSCTSSSLGTDRSTLRLGSPEQPGGAAGRLTPSAPS
eukprot:TRINITY_DN35412_c0_g1_i1.p1 TRINITY_DN35412_c0_g1~~TRINITY_DN35412_c0_g1_i1.p1  ORF type:complete len:341 (+),score=43.21 TRINITY_DN35412_c0_g1_i1:50-1024(+)